MITVTVPKREVYDQETGIFHYTKEETTFQLEHSLASLQQWESIWHVPFLSKEEKTAEQTVSYMRCMCLTPGIEDDVFYCILPKDVERIMNYMNDSMTATWFREQKGPGGKKRAQIVTAEVIYYWMVSANIPAEYRYWHLNQLLTLIRVISEENRPKKKRSKREILEEQQSINERNKKLFNTRG